MREQKVTVILMDCAVNLQKPLEVVGLVSDDAPGLAITPDPYWLASGFQEKQNDQWGGCVVTHTASGGTLSCFGYPNLAKAEEALKRYVASGVNWTLSMEEIVKSPVVSSFAIEESIEQIADWEDTEDDEEWEEFLP